MDKGYFAIFGSLLVIQLEKSADHPGWFCHQQGRNPVGFEALLCGYQELVLEQNEMGSAT